MNYFAQRCSVQGCGKPNTRHSVFPPGMSGLPGFEDRQAVICWCDEHEEEARLRRMSFHFLLDDNGQPVADESGVLVLVRRFSTEPLLAPKAFYPFPAPPA